MSQLRCFKLAYILTHVCVGYCVIGQKTRKSHSFASFSGYFIIFVPINESYRYMEHKEFMAEVQRRTRMDKQQCALLLNSFERILQDEALNMTDIDIEGFGRFESHNHPEYIKENEETCEVILYPPRITCRFHAVFPLNEEKS